jgi:hypothetical protein
MRRDKDFDRVCASCDALRPGRRAARAAQAPHSAQLALPAPQTTPEPDVASPAPPEEAAQKGTDARQCRDA